MPTTAFQNRAGVTKPSPGGVARSQMSKAERNHLVSHLFQIRLPAEWHPSYPGDLALSRF